MEILITEEEALALKDRILHDSAFRDELFMMAPIGNLISLILRSRSIADTEPNRRSAFQKIYEILCYDLSSPDGKIRCDTRFWKDVERVVCAKYDGWLTMDEGRRIIEDMICRRDVSRFKNLVNDICESRLYKILSIYDKSLLAEMVDMVVEKYACDDYALLKAVRNPGKLKGHIKKTVYNLFLKWQVAKITEAFENPNGKDCGYAHLSMTVKESKLIEYFGQLWYELTMKIPFRSSVERYYDPYGESPCYRESAEKNDAIAEDLRRLFLELKASKGIGGDFPAGDPEVSYNKTFEPGMEIEEHYSPGLETILLCYRKPESDPSDPDGKEDEFKEPAGPTEVPMTESDSEVIVSRFRIACATILGDPVKMDIFIRKILYEQPSKEIGYDLYMQGHIDESVLKGFPPASEKGLCELAKKVDKLMQTAREAFMKAIRKVGDYEQEDLLAFFSYIVMEKSKL